MQGTVDHRDLRLGLVCPVLLEVERGPLQEGILRGLFALVDGLGLADPAVSGRDQALTLGVPVGGEVGPLALMAGDPHGGCGHRIRCGVVGHELVTQVINRASAHACDLTQFAL